MKSVKQDALNAGIELWPHITVRSVAKKIGVAHSAVLYHFKSLEQLKNSIATHAIDTHNVGVVSQMIVSDHPMARTLTAKERQSYLAHQR